MLNMLMCIALASNSNHSEISMLSMTRQKPKKHLQCDSVQQHNAHNVRNRLCLHEDGISLHDGAGCSEGQSVGHVDQILMKDVAVLALLC